MTQALAFEVVEPQSIPGLANTNSSWKPSLAPRGRSRTAPKCRTKSAPAVASGQSSFRDGKVLACEQAGVERSGSGTPGTRRYSGEKRTPLVEHGVECRATHLARSKAVHSIGCRVLPTLLRGPVYHGSPSWANHGWRIVGTAWSYASNRMSRFDLRSHGSIEGDQRQRPGRGKRARYESAQSFVAGWRRRVRVRKRGSRPGGSFISSTRSSCCHRS